MRKSRLINIGNVPIGGGSPVSIQSMTNTDTRDILATLGQIEQLHNFGCQLVRCAVPDMAAAQALRSIAQDSPIPVIADIHFDHRLALAAIRNKVAAIRLNPGNLDAPAKLKDIINAAKDAGISIRVGANSGSINAHLLHSLKQKISDPVELMVEALCHSALDQCSLLESFGFHDIKVSLKSSSVPITVKAYQRFAAETDYPLHVGITEAGTPGRGIVKSSVGIGALLLDGIGDTIRVSLTADPQEEVIVARRILESCALREAMPEIISCPTCGRTEIDLVGLTNRVESLVEEIKAEGKIIHLKKIAIMGCVVNGPGEARDADLGIAGGRNKVAVFRFGEVVGTFDLAQGFEFLKMEILKQSRPSKPR